MREAGSKCQQLTLKRFSEVIIIVSLVCVCARVCEGERARGVASSCPLGEAKTTFPRIPFSVRFGGEWAEGNSSPRPGRQTRGGAPAPCGSSGSEAGESCVLAAVGEGSAVRLSRPRPRSSGCRSSTSHPGVAATQRQRLPGTFPARLLDLQVPTQKGNAQPLVHTAGTKCGRRR